MNKIILFLNVFIILNIFHLPALGQDPWLDSTDKKVLLHGGIASATIVAGSYFADQAIDDFFQENQNAALDNYSGAMDFIGDYKVIFSLNALTLGGGFLMDNNQLKQTSFNAFKSILSAGIITGAGKEIFGRARPDLNKGPHFFKPFPFFNDYGDDYRSFPSGHTTVAFAFFTPFAEEYSRWLYLVPASIGFSRIYKNKHWTTDVLMGTAIGFFTGYFFQHKTRNIEVSLNKIVFKF